MRTLRLLLPLAVGGCEGKGHDSVVGPHYSCFVAGTRVLTPRGPVPIESLSVGDEVVSYSLAERRAVTRRVERVLQARAASTLRLEAGGSVIAGVTAEHPFYDAAAGAFRPAEDLSARSRLLLQTGEGSVDPVPLARRTLVPGAVTVYNLTVQGPEHNYFAEGLLVHNKSPGSVDFSAEWGADSMTLTIQNGSGPHWLGMAETGCAEADNCWYGEDCLYGDLSATYFYCHPTSAEGVTLAYTANPDLAEGTETLLSDAQEDAVTYYVESTFTGACWIWGHDTSYYAGLGCETL